MIGRIWKMLRFQAQSCILGVNMAMLAVSCSVQLIAGVKLQPGLRRLHRHNAAAFRFDYANSFPQFTLLAV